MFSDYVVLITGASSGIGLGIAREFVKAGATVVGTDLDGDRLAAAGEELGDKFIPKVSDVRQESQIVDLSAYVAETFQRLDVLVNNAGVIKVVGPEQMTEKDFYNEYDVTVKGPMLMVKYFAALLRKSTNPSIANISSSGQRKIMFHGESCRFDILPDETVCARKDMCNGYRRRFDSELVQGARTRRNCDEWQNNLASKLRSACSAAGSCGPPGWLRSSLTRSRMS